MSRALDRASAEFDVMPTVGSDPVVESGSNADGEWTRWADGTQICRGSLQISAPNYITSKAFPYYSNTFNGEGPHTLPANFVDATYNVMATDTGASVVPAAAPNNTSSFVMTIVLSPQSLSAPGVGCAWLAAGYWK